MTKTGKIYYKTNWRTLLFSQRKKNQNKSEIIVVKFEFKKKKCKNIQ